ncbi:MULTISPECIES: glycosyltransferase family protein [Streptomyces]|uniref:hypothetical protein n=1 Tax=Streptomyces TaxID=1883 RepID=UPI0002D67FFB|nr:hypothetical protein [Streptomyces sp. AA0539]
MTTARTAVPARGTSRRTRARTALRAAAPALLVYAAVRATGLLILARWTAAGEHSAHTLLAERWDAVWYARIAENGYGYTAHLGERTEHDLAFFPLYPALERGLSTVLPLSVPDAGLAVSWTAGLAAAWGLYAVAFLVTGRRAAGVVLAALWAAVPPGFVQSMAYTETLFTALAAWALYAVLTGRWYTAGALAVAAGLTRPSGLAVVAAVLAGGALELRRRRRADPRVLTAMALAPLGWLGYVGYVGVRLSSPTGYFDVQKDWGNGFDGGAGFTRFVLTRLRTDPGHGLLILAVLACGIALLIQCVRQRQPLPLLVYTLLIAASALVSESYFASRPRLLMPAFPLLLPLAGLLLRLPRPAGAAALVAAALGSGGYGTWFLLTQSPP